MHIGHLPKLMNSIGIFLEIISDGYVWFFYDSFTPINFFNEVRPSLMTLSTVAAASLRYLSQGHSAAILAAFLRVKRWTRKSVSIRMLLPISMYDTKLELENILQPTRQLALWLFELQEPGLGPVVYSDGKLAATEELPKLVRTCDYGEQLPMSQTVLLLLTVQFLQSVGYDLFNALLVLIENPCNSYKGALIAWQGEQWGQAQRLFQPLAGNLALVTPVESYILACQGNQGSSNLTEVQNKTSVVIKESEKQWLWKLSQFIYDNIDLRPWRVAFCCSLACELMAQRSGNCEMLKHWWQPENNKSLSHSITISVQYCRAILKVRLGYMFCLLLCINSTWSLLTQEYTFNLSVTNPSPQQCWPVTG